MTQSPPKAPPPNTPPTLILEFQQMNFGGNTNDQPIVHSENQVLFGYAVDSYYRRGAPKL